ncbi:hypothetical protein XFF6992_230166 [Xanthomonas citri pv. fuscans]|nr:hypothetical protein XFF6992_230166 [Xanthomonas citri pv. fuscans]
MTTLFIGPYLNFFVFNSIAALAVAHDRPTSLVACTPKIHQSIDP